MGKVMHLVAKDWERTITLQDVPVKGGRTGTEGTIFLTINQMKTCH